MKEKKIYYALAALYLHWSPEYELVGFRANQYYFLITFERDVPYPEWPPVENEQNKSYFMTKSEFDEFSGNQEHFDLDWPPEKNNPQPTWEKLVEAEALGFLHYLNIDAKDHTSENEAIRVEATDALLEHNKEDIYVGAGLSHMTGLSYLLEHCTIAGQRLPAVVLRDDKGVAHVYHSQKELRDLLNKLAERENMIESAHNELTRKHDELVAKSEDASVDGKDRYQARLDAIALLHKDNYKVNLEKEMKAYDPDALPSKLRDIKDVYIERLEGVATGKIAKIKNAATQHGVDLPASCVDQQNGETMVSTKKQKGQIDILRSKNKKEVEDTFATWRKRINDVEILNVPVFYLGTQAVAENTKKKPIVLQGAPNSGPVSLPVIAKHPIGTDINSNVVITVDSETFSVGNRSPVTRKEKRLTKDYQITFEIPRTYTGVVDIEMTATNLCGPSKFYLQWKPL